MTPPGHLAAAYLLARRAPDRLSRLWPLALGALLPDLIDKPAMVLGLTPYGRTVGHSLTLYTSMLAALSLATLFRLPQAAGLGLLVLGGLSHLAVDLVDDVVEGLTYGGWVFSAWLGWPATNPDMLNVRAPHLFPARRDAITVLEIATALAAIALMVRDRARGAPT